MDDFLSNFAHVLSLTAFACVVSRNPPSLTHFCQFLFFIFSILKWACIESLKDPIGCKDLVFLFLNFHVIQRPFVSGDCSHCPRQCLPSLHWKGVTIQGFCKIIIVITFICTAHIHTFSQALIPPPTTLIIQYNPGNSNWDNSNSPANWS